MAEPGSGRRDLSERLGLAAVGAVALTAERADRLADALAARGALRRDEARDVIEDLIVRWRGETTRFGERAGAGLHNIFRDLGVVRRDEYDELELRVAQLEHRLRLLEEPPEPRAAESDRSRRR